jgi:hypothetical protein
MENLIDNNGEIETKKADSKVIVAVIAVLFVVLSPFLIVTCHIVFCIFAHLGIISEDNFILLYLGKGIVYTVQWLGSFGATLFFKELLHAYVYLLGGILDWFQ